MPLPTTLDKWLKKTTPDDTGLTRPPVVMRVSAHKDEVLGSTTKMRSVDSSRIFPNSIQGASVTTPVVYFASVFDSALTLRGWATVNKPLPTKWPDREKTYSELSVSLGQEDIFQMGARQ